MDNGEVKIIDFGESKEYLLDEDNNPATMATIRGTPQYLSPILWKAHVLTPGTKQVEHNMYKSDVFSAGLVIFQLASIRDVTGFNQKTMYTDGEKLIKEGLQFLSKKYSSKVIDPIRSMLIFDEDKRPTFIDLAKMIFGDNYVPKIDKMEKNLRSESASNLQKKEKSDDEKRDMFKQYVEKQKLTFNLNKITYWFEYGGNMIAKYYVNKEDSKWKLIGKYKNEFPSHYIMVYIDEDIGHFLIGGIDSNNTFQFRDGQIIKKSSMSVDRSFMAVINLRNVILAIGGYDYNEKTQLKSIELYDIDQDKWSQNTFEDLKVARSQAQALLYNNQTIFIFGGYNKSLGTLSSIEKISLSDKKTELLDFKLPIPLRRFAMIKISESRVMIMGGITRLCKESDHVYCLDYEKKSFIKFSALPKAGIIDHEVLLDEIGNVHLFFETNYGTSPPVHYVYNYLDFS